MDKIKFEDIVKLYLNGDKTSISDLVLESNTMPVKYLEVDMETGLTSPAFKSVYIKGLSVGVQNKADNVDSEDSTSGANVNLAEAETLAYPLMKYINKLIDVISEQSEIIEEQNEKINELDSRVKALEEKPTPITPIQNVID